MFVCSHIYSCTVHIILYIPVYASHIYTYTYTYTSLIYTMLTLLTSLTYTPHSYALISIYTLHTIGKSTLLKIMTQELQPLIGDVRPHAHLRISKFSQHFIDVLDLTQNPLDYFVSAPTLSFYRIVYTFILLCDILH